MKSKDNCPHCGALRTTSESALQDYRPVDELDKVIQLQDALAWLDSEYRIADAERISLRAELQAIKDRDPCLHAALDYIKKTSK